MDKVRALAVKAWAKYRGWPMWGQIVGGVVAVSVIVGPFLPDQQKGDKQAETASVVTAPTGTTVVETTDAATTTSTASSTTVRATTTTAPLADPSCEDARNDGAGSFDLLDASFHTMGSSRIATATFVGPASGRDVLVSFLLGHDRDGDDYAYQISAKKLADGSVVAFVFDVGATKNTDLDTAVVTGGSVRVVVPEDLVSEIRGNNVDFQVVLSVDGLDIDSCPDDGFVSP